MSSLPLRAVAFVLAVALPATSGAEEPVGPAPPPLELLPPAQPEVVATPEVPSEATPTAEPAVIETETVAPPATDPEPPPPTISPADHEALYASTRAESTRDLGASAMVGAGLVTVGGVVLILAGFGATARALKRSDCDTNLCTTEDRGIKNAARVTLAGLAISTIGAVGFIAAAAVYGVGNARVQRARNGSGTMIGLAPAQRGAALSLHGRF